jgi:hypothetical protein
MKIADVYSHLILESVGTVWYHGSPRFFKKFDGAAERINRGSNPAGIYVTTNYDLALEYAGQNGHVYTVSPKVRKTFIERKTKLDSKLAQSYKNALIKHTNYKADWIDKSLIPEMYDLNRLKHDLEGTVKTETYAGAGYDSYQFVDMFDVSLVVFDAGNVKIIETTSARGNNAP